MMRFFLDHDVPRQIGEILSRHGYDAVSLKSELPVTATDEEVLAHATRTGRILVTCNRDDFLKLVKNADHPGLIILIRRHSHVSEQGHLLRLISLAGENGLAGNVNFA